MINVLILTYNRPLLIEKICNDCISEYRGNIFKFTIYDSSTNNETAQIVSSYVGGKCKYVNCDSRIDVIEKVQMAIDDNNDDYFFLYGDTALVDFNAIETILCDMHYETCSLIEVSYKYMAIRQGDVLSSDENTVLFYNDEIKFIRNHFTRLTCMGSYIMSNKCYKIAEEKDILEKYSNSSWYSAGIVPEILHLGADMLKYRYATIYSNCIKWNSAPKNGSLGWKQTENYYKYVFEDFNTLVDDLLPERYNAIKDYLILDLRQENLASLRFMVGQRLRKVINLSRTLKYRQSIRRVSGYYWKMVLLSFIPAKLLCFIRNVILRRDR